MRSIPKCEQETIIRWAADETRATITSSNPVVIRKLDKLIQAAPEDYRKERDLSDSADARYTMTAKLLRFGKPASEAQKAANREILSKINSTP